MRNCILLFCLILIVPTTAAAKIKTTEDLVSAMQKKYAKSLVPDRDLCAKDHRL